MVCGSVCRHASPPRLPAGNNVALNVSASGCEFSWLDRFIDCNVLFLASPQGSFWTTISGLVGRSGYPAAEHKRAGRFIYEFFCYDHNLFYFHRLDRSGGLLHPRYDHRADLPGYCGKYQDPVCAGWNCSLAGNGSCGLFQSPPSARFSAARKHAPMETSALHYLCCLYYLPNLRMGDSQYDQTAQSGVPSRGDDRAHAVKGYVPRRRPWTRRTTVSGTCSWLGALDTLGG